MENILNRKGEVISRSRNLAGIRRYVGNHIIKVLSVSRIGNGDEGKLCILFEDGSSFETNFADFGVLCGFVRRWRNVRGAPLVFCGDKAGVVRRDHALLEVYAR